MTFEISNSIIAFFLEFKDIWFNNFLFLINFLIALESWIEFFFLTKIPFRPLITTSLQPPIFEAIIGLPHAAASNKILGTPSWYDGNTIILENLIVLPLVIKKKV